MPDLDDIVPRLYVPAERYTTWPNGQAVMAELISKREFDVVRVA
jgi:hypothetical protein